MAEGIYVLSDDDRRKFAKIVSSSWLDSEFAQRYQAEPLAVLAEHGIDYPASVAPPLVPPKPTGDLSLEAMESIAAGLEAAAEGTFGSASSISTIGGTAFTASTFGSMAAE
jgi:putative thiazole/oxazole-modified microcin (TOMM)-like peptide